MNLQISDPVRLSIVEDLLKQYPNQELIHEEIELINHKINQKLHDNHDNPDFDINLFIDRIIENIQIKLNNFPKKELKNLYLNQAKFKININNTDKLLSNCNQIIYKYKDDHHLINKGVSNNGIYIKDVLYQLIDNDFVPDDSKKTMNNIRPLKLSKNSNCIPVFSSEFTV